jgi:hypothetical protein
MDPVHAKFKHDVPVYSKGQSQFGETRLFRTPRFNHEERSDASPTETHVREERSSTGPFQRVDQQNAADATRKRFPITNPLDNLEKVSGLNQEINQVHDLEAKKPERDVLRQPDKPVSQLNPANMDLLGSFPEEPGTLPLPEEPVMLPLPKEPGMLPLPDPQFPAVREFSEVQEIHPQSGVPIMNLFRDLIMWRNVRQSGLIFSLGLVLFLALSYFSLVSLFAYGSLAVVLLMEGFVFGRQLLFFFQQRNREPHPFHRMIERDVVISPDYVRNQVDTVLHPINRFLVRMRNLYLADSLAETLKMMLYLYILTYIGAWFNLFTLVMMAWVGIFTIPKLYSLYGRRLNAGLEKLENLRIKIQHRLWLLFDQQREKIRLRKQSSSLSSPEKEKTVSNKREVKIEKVQ